MQLKIRDNKNAYSQYGIWILYNCLIIIKCRLLISEYSTFQLIQSCDVCLSDYRNVECL